MATPFCDLVLKIDPKDDWRREAPPIIFWGVAMTVKNRGDDGQVRA